MSSPAEKDFEDLRVHFSDKQWNKLKEVEKIIYLNQKSNHLFKLSVGLTSKVPEFMRKSAPKPKKKKKRDEDEWIDSDEEESEDPPPVKKTHRSAEFPSDRNLRIRTNVVDYTEPTQMDWSASLRQQSSRGSTAVKIQHQEVETEAVLDRSLRRKNVVNYNYEEKEDERGTDQEEASTPQPSEGEDSEEWEESGDEESIPSDEDSGGTDQKETSAPQPIKKRGEESKDEQSIPSDEESDEDATETVKVVSPRVSLLRSSVDCMKAKMRQETSDSAPQPSEEEEENEDEQSIPSDEESGDATETAKGASPRVSLLRSSVDSIKAKMRHCD